MKHLNSPDYEGEERREELKNISKMFWKVIFWVLTAAVGLSLSISGFVASDMRDDIKDLQSCAKDNRENIVILKAQYEYIAGTLGEIKQFMKENQRR